MTLAFLSSQVSSIDTALAWGVRGCELSPVSTNALVKIECALIPVKKQLTANYILETRTKLEELIPAAMVKYGLNRVQLPLWLQQSLFNGFSWYGLSWAIVVSEHL